MTSEQLLIEQLQHSLLHIANDLYKEEFTLYELESAKHTIDHSLKKIDEYYKQKE